MIKATVSVKNNTYKLETAQLVDNAGNAITNSDIEVSLNGGTIEIKVKNEPITGAYNVELRKVDANGNALIGVVLNEQRYDFGFYLKNSV